MCRGFQGCYSFFDSPSAAPIALIDRSVAVSESHPDRTLGKF